MQVNSYELGQYVKIIDDIFTEKHIDIFFRKSCKKN